MVRKLKLLLIAFGWLLGLAVSILTIWIFLFGIRVAFSASLTNGLLLIGASFVLGWVLKIFKNFLWSSWNSVPFQCDSSQTD